MQRIKLVIFDADGVLFRSNSDCYLGQASPPLRRVDEDIVEDSVGCRIKLDPQARKVLHELKRRGIHVSLDSTNRHREAEEVLHALKLDELLEHSKINFSDKGSNILEILRDFREKDGLQFSPGEVMFVDDVEQFCLDAKKVLKGRGIILQMGKDVSHLSELLEML
jgi:magnesium-dependent phosphatase-1